jgi:hypothetical protein
MKQRKIAQQQQQHHHHHHHHHHHQHHTEALQTLMAASSEVAASSALHEHKVTPRGLQRTNELMDEEDPVWADGLGIVPVRREGKGSPAMNDPCRECVCASR